MVKASIDIGSNSLLLLVADQENQKYQVLEDHSWITGLGKGLKGQLKEKKFDEESKRLTRIAIDEILKILQKFDVLPEDVIATATEASRLAIDADEFYNEIKKDYGINVNIISAQGEAYYTSLGVSQFFLKENEITLIDIGGASSELIDINCNPFKMKKFKSLPLGSVVTRDLNLDQESLKLKIKGVFREYKLIDDFAPYKLIGVGGTLTTLATMMRGLSKFKREEIEGLEFNFDESDIFLQKISKLSQDDLLKHYPFLGKRASTIISGGVLALEFFRALNLKSFTVSTVGLRYGTLSAGECDESFIR